MDVLDLIAQEGSIVKMLEQNTEHLNSLKKHEADLRLERARICYLLNEEYKWALHDIADICGIHETTISREIRDYKKQGTKSTTIEPVVDTKTLEDHLAEYRRAVEEADSVVPTD